jgi:hypothetical protein
VAFQAVLDTGGVGIFTGSGGATTSIVDSSGLFSFFGGPAINDEGTVAFLANLNTGGEGIFTGSGSVTNKVIATGDTLFGSTVTQLFFYNEGLNNTGQLAFFARLADGTSGIFRADPESTSEPQPVPEPTSALGLLAVGLLGVGMWRKRQQLRTS